MIDVKGISQRRKLVVALAVLLVLIVSWSGLIDTLSKDYVNASTVQALAAYGFARLINAAVSTASSIAISVSPLGFGFDVQPFQVLDPINDLVEQYSSAMKFSVSSLVVQKILVEAVSASVFKIVLTVLAAIFVFSIYIRNGAYSFLLFRIFCLFAMVRFLIVFVVVMNGIVDQAFVDKNITPRMQEVSEVANRIQSQTTASDNQLSQDERAGLESMIDELETEKGRAIRLLSAAEAEADQADERVEVSRRQIDEMESEMGTIEKLNVFSRKEEYQKALTELEVAREEYDALIEEQVNFEERVEELDRDIQNATDLLEGEAVEEGWLASARKKIANFRDMAKWERITESVESIVPSMLNLMAAFILKTLILPLIFLALLLKGFKYIWGVDPRSWVQKEYEDIKNYD